jgi:hypothetical protein
MRQEVDATREVSRLELWRRASQQGDQEAWAAFQQGLEETVLAWFHARTSSFAASRVQSESHFVARAFEQVWPLAVQRQVACQALSEVLVYLRASLNGAILEGLRVARHLGSASSLPDRQEPSKSSVVWGKLQAALSNEQERRLAYLLYHCGLSPAESACCSPQEWSDVREVARLRRRILARLMQSPLLVAPGEIGEIQPAPASSSARWDGVSMLARLDQSYQAKCRTRQRCSFHPALLDEQSVNFSRGPYRPIRTLRAQIHP